MNRGKYELKYSDYQSSPKYVLSEIIEAESPLHAGLTFAKMCVTEKARTRIGMVVHKVNDGDFEVHVKKIFVNGVWVFHGQVYKDKGPLMFTS